MVLRRRGRNSPSPEPQIPPPPPPPPPQERPPPPQPQPPPPPPPAAPEEVPPLADEDMFASLPPLVIPPPPSRPGEAIEILPLNSPSPTGVKIPVVMNWLDKYGFNVRDKDDVEFSVESFPDLPSPRGVAGFDMLDPYADDYYINQQHAYHPVAYDGEDGDIVIPMSPSARLVGAGLENLGSTCFMSSILQCLTHTIMFNQGLRFYDHDCPDDAGEFCVFCALRSHMGLCFTPARTVVSPTFLADHLNQFEAAFQRGRQEDAHEFMNRALDKLQGCFPEGHPNLVEEVFGGRCVSQVKCTNCGRCSDTFESTIDLSLGIENINFIKEALDSYFKVEMIDGKVNCSGCNKDVTVEKQLRLTKAPSVAAFHLKRFTGGGIAVEKIRNHVFFTLELDLQPYTFGAENDNVELKYDLYAVVVHIGDSPNLGHYFCFVRSAPDKWHKLDDAKVTSVPGDEVLSQEAYMLFYARQGTPWFSSIIEDVNSSYPHSGSGNKGDCGGDEKIEDQHSDQNSLLGNKGDSGSGEETEDDPMDAYDESVRELGVAESREKCDTTHNQVPPD